MELYEVYISLCLTWRLDCDYYLGLLASLDQLRTWAVDKKTP